MKDKSAVVGLGYTDQGKVPGRSALSLLIEASRNAASDAGLSIKDIDGIIIEPCPSEPYVSAFDLSQEMGLELKFGADEQLQGASAGAILQHAAMAVDAGLCNYCLCAFADTSYSRPGAGGVTYQSGRGINPCFGMFGVAASYALIARRYMYEYGATSRQFGIVSVNNRYHASLNPRAIFRERITIEDHQASRWVVEPLRLLDCCPVHDGGRALIVTTADRARHLKQPPVYIMGFGQGHPFGDPLRRKILTVTGAVQSGRAAFAMAGISPTDVNMCCIYDAFSFLVPIQLEDLGFCNKGEGADFIQGGRITLGGELPVNTSGGLLSEVYLQGWVGTHEAVSQLRGDCGLRQVSGATIALLTSSGGALSEHATVILRR